MNNAYIFSNIYDIITIIIIRPSQGHGLPFHDPYTAIH